MELLKDKHFQKKINFVCRICLGQEAPGFKTLFQRVKNLSISEMVMNIARVQINHSDGFPSVICKLCFGELEIAHHFREKCESSDQTLRKYYANAGIAGEIIENSDDCDEKCSALDSAGVIKTELWLPEAEEIQIKNIKRKKQKKNVSLSFANETETSLKKDTGIKDEVDELEHDLNEFENDVDNIVEDLGSKSEEKCVFECHLCQKPLKTKLSLSRHLMSMHKDRQQKGVVTGYGLQRRFHCTDCSYSTRHSQSLVYHARVHSGERPHACRHCGKRFTQPGSLTCHLKTHSDRTYYTCAQCGKQFKYRETYNAHQNVHNTEKKYVCHICNQGLKAKKTLESHMNRHYNIRNFNCETCGATFVTHVELLNHSKKHTADKKFHCTLCDFKTYMKKGLETHLKRHSGERPYKCPHCELSCYTNGELKCHMRKHTREKNFSCPVCGLRFIHGSSVNKHMLKTHGIKYSRKDQVDRRIVKPQGFLQPQMATVA